ncbi:MAG TPA: (4Fe-4S)-binding protein [Candidatus Margulisbacteria bacterium]|nr:MAG: hypothetical protein A2X41_05920 [Candidatus Margulisbacteria bacterium GWE2_39_32]HCT85958.1 (4Fe-4S)-binding protein [Candidatus Margulisiibacteriota bacterium]
MKIAIASGKGGTGKSTLAINVAYLLTRNKISVCLKDCDVEEPNCHIFIREGRSNIEKAEVAIPKIDNNLCVNCNKCVDLCAYNALAKVPGKVLVFSDLCHSCGGCTMICPVGAITEISKEIGLIKNKRTQKLQLITGELKIGEAKSPPLIKKVKAYPVNSKIQIIDCPPGTACPAVSAIKDTDHVWLVTEPTPFGLHDLDLIVKVVRKLGISHSIIINKSGYNDNIIETYAQQEAIPIITRIPMDLKIIQTYSAGGLIIDIFPEYTSYFEPLINFVKEKIH